ncbi:MAG: septum formation initiator family protein [Candidatus Krumholzibacteriota bacterium]|nr:septum formation initiator family protein [Candidatus Krumholzibacteriota bacterium]
MKSLWGQGSRYLRINRGRVDVNPNVARAILLAAAAIIVAVFVAGDVGLWNLWRAQQKMQRLEREIGELETTNATLMQEIELIGTDPFAIEKIAREKYGYLRPGDRVYRIITLPADGEITDIDASSLDRDARTF